MADTSHSGTQQPEVTWKVNSQFGLNIVKQIFCLSSVKAKAKYIPQKTKGMDFLQVVNFVLCRGWGQSSMDATQASGAMWRDGHAPGGRDPGRGQPRTVTSELGNRSKSLNHSESQALYFQKRDQPLSQYCEDWRKMWMRTFLMVPGT